MKLTKKEAQILLAINLGCPAYGISPMPMGKEMIDAITEALKDEENELQRLVRKIEYKHHTIDDLVKADDLTRKKIKEEQK